MRAELSYRRIRLGLLLATQVAVPAWLGVHVRIDARRACWYWGDVGGAWDRCVTRVMTRAAETSWGALSRAVPAVASAGMSAACLVLLTMLPGVRRRSAVGLVAGGVSTFAMAVALTFGLDWGAMAEGGFGLITVPSVVAFTVWSTRWLAIAVTLPDASSGIAWASLVGTTTFASLLGSLLLLNFTLVWLLPVAALVRTATRRAARSRGRPDGGRRWFAAVYPLVCGQLLVAGGVLLPVVVR